MVFLYIGPPSTINECLDSWRRRFLGMSGSWKVLSPHQICPFSSISPPSPNNHIDAFLFPELSIAVNFSTCYIDWAKDWDSMCCFERLRRGVKLLAA